MLNMLSNPTSEWEERKLLQQIVSLGVGYPYGNRLAASKAAISNTDTLHRLISRMLDAHPGGIIREAQDHIQNGDCGYYLLDLHKSRILTKWQYLIEDIIVDFTLSGAEDRVLLRKRKGTCLYETGFLIVPDAVFFLGANRIIAPLKEFHVLSFISLEADSKSGFVVDYDVSQSNRPLVLFPCEENNDIIQSQLDHDDRCWTEELESFIGNIGFGWKNT